MKTVQLDSQRNYIVSGIKKESIFATLYKFRYLYMMSVPFVIWVIIFKYLPIWGWVMAFKNFKPGIPFSQQKWLGLTMFIQMFKDPEFFLAMRNTLVMSLMSLVVGFTFPVAFAVLLNEVKNVIFKRSIQTISYLPHFVSWVIVASLVTEILSAEGVVNNILVNLNVIGKPIAFMTQGKLFWLLVTFTDLWKEMGWNAIIYLAAITGIDPGLYEAAKVDGAGRLKQIWHITLPCIRPTIILLVIMSIGNLISIGFEKQMLLGNALVKDYSNVLDLYILNYGIGLQRYSYGTALGIFKSVISIALLLAANKFAKKIGEGQLL